MTPDLAHAPERLETARLILRRPAPRDWPQARDFFMSDRSAGVGGPHDEGRAWRVFASELGHWEIRGYGMWAVTLRGGDDTCVALIGPWHPVDWPETEIGWMVWDPAIEGTGIATEAARAAIAHAWSVLGWTTVVSYVGEGNERSARLAEKLGAVLDPDAPQPKPDSRCHVYRHPGPGTGS
jgi:RimJ/RimL family protein N-acetyltransferase